jgi:recombination protein RecR
MTNLLPKQVDQLSELFRLYPGVGKKSALKLALDTLSLDKLDFDNIIKAMGDMREQVHYCKISGVLSETEVSLMLSDPSREQHQICIVEKPTDVLSIEKTGFYKGTYHVLFQMISPLDNVFVENTNLPKLFERIKNLPGKIELLLFLKNTFAADATVAYLKEYLISINRAVDVRITRLAQGLPLYFNTEYLDEATVIKALQDRREI